MIVIRQSVTADTRTCDYTTVTEHQLRVSSEQHINDVQRALDYFAERMYEAGARHDTDKLTDIAGFHADFVTGFAEGHQGWWDRHRKLNRHHLNLEDGIPYDVDLIDVFDFIADCVMAGMARSGSVRPLDIAPDVLMRAFQNTAKKLEAQIVVTA